MNDFRDVKSGSSEAIVSALSVVLRMLAFLGLVISVLLVALGQYWVVVLGGISPVSVGGVCGLYLLMYHRLERDGIGRGQSIVLAILFANVFVQSFEVVYHFTFPVYFDYFKAPFLNADDFRFIVVEGTMLLPVVLVRRHLHFGYLSALLLVSFVTLWVVWILFGFPQYFVPGLYYPQILTSTNRFHASLILNFLSKTLLALLFASLVQRRLR